MIDPRLDGLTAEFMIVTPAIADEMLTRNLDNRPLARNRKDVFARVMVEGMWLANNQGIGFDTNDRLVDGQHRLCAIRDSGVSVVLLVVRGLRPRADQTIDRNGTRAVYEMVRRAGGTPQPRELTAWLNALTLLRTSSPGTATPDDVRAFYLAHKDHLDWMLSSAPSSNRLRAAGVWAAVLVARLAGLRDVAGFVAGLISGEDLRAGSPALALRTYLIDAPSNGGGRVGLSVALRTLRALIAHGNKEKLPRLHEAGEAMLARALRDAGLSSP